MPLVDQFESVFRSATRDVFDYQPVTIGSTLVVTDMAPDEAKQFTDSVRVFFAASTIDDVHWHTVSGDQFQTTSELLEIVTDIDADLICTYRNLHSRACHFPHSLGEHLDVLTQKTATPVLVLPHPEAGDVYEHALKNTDVVMAITDHVIQDSRMVNYGVRFTRPGGTLFLTHVEDDVAFDRVIDAISRIPSIDTDDARAKLHDQLLKRPRDYINSCRQTLKEAGVPLTVEAIVEFGHRLSLYRAHIDAAKVDLLLMNTKDDDQLAMHGLAYPLAVELRGIPLLLL